MFWHVRSAKRRFTLSDGRRTSLESSIMPPPRKPCRCIPEIFLGVLLTVAIFAMGMVFESSRQPPSDKSVPKNTDHGNAIVTAEKSPEITDWLLVLFNGLLFGSTALLWGANKRSAKIAERALTELEAPFVQIKVLHPGLDTTTASEGRLSFCFVNHGRTPARILELLDEIRPTVIGEFPEPGDPRIQRGRGMPFGITAPPQGECDEFGRVVMRGQLTGPPAGPQNFAQRLLYLVGYIQYADVFENIFTVGFCLLYDPVRCRWAIRGDERYNYHRKEEGPYVPPTAP
jgi:hypothetical protein